MKNLCVYFIHEGYYLHLYFHAHSVDKTVGGKEILSSPGEYIISGGGSWYTEHPYNLSN